MTGTVIRSVPRASLLGRADELAQARGRTDVSTRWREISTREGSIMTLAGRTLRDFGSADHLGLAQHPEVVAGLQEAAAWKGVGAGITAQLGRVHAEQRALEDAVAQWQGYPRALLLGSRSLAHLAVAQTLLRPGDLCVQDKLDPAGLADAVRLSGADLKRYPHLTADAALRQLRSRPEAAALLATDGVFPIDGDLADLKILAVLARAENALLYVDDSHGVGIIGPEGRGSVAHAGLGPREVPLQLIGLEAAFGCAGALLVGQEALIEAIAGRARAWLHEAMPPPALAAAALRALELVRDEGWRRFKLAARVARFRRGAQQFGLPLLDSTTAIQSLLIGSQTAAVKAAERMADEGFLVDAIHPPTVPDGRARLRIQLSALHEEHDIDALLVALARVLKSASLVDL